MLRLRAWSGLTDERLLQLLAGLLHLNALDLANCGALTDVALTQLAAYRRVGGGSSNRGDGSSGSKGGAATAAPGMLAEWDDYWDPDPDLDLHLPLDLDLDLQQAVAASLLTAPAGSSSVVGAVPGASLADIEAGVAELQVVQEGACIGPDGGPDPEGVSGPTQPEGTALLPCVGSSSGGSGAASSSRGGGAAGPAAVGLCSLNLAGAWGGGEDGAVVGEGGGEGGWGGSRGGW